MGVLDLQSEYIVTGFEVGQEGTQHIQGYCHYKNAVSFNTVKGCLPRAHIEKARGSPEQNYDYCTKDGDYIEFGELPQQGKCSFEYIQEVMENPQLNFQVYNQYRRSYEAYKKILQEKWAKAGPKSLCFVSQDKMDQVIEAHKETDPEEQIFYDSDIDTYNGEDIVFLDAYGHGSFQVHKWMQGFPKRIKRGYEIIKVDPAYLYIVYDDKAQLAHIKNCFSNLDYIVWSKECENQEGIDPIEGYDIQKQDDLKESIEKYDLTRR